MSKRKVKNINNANSNILKKITELGVIFTMVASGVGTYKLASKIIDKVNQNTNKVTENLVNGLEFNYGTTNNDNNVSKLYKSILDDNTFTFFNLSRDMIKNERELKRAIDDGMNVGLIVEPTIDDNKKINISFTKIKELLNSYSINGPILYDISLFLKSDNGIENAKRLMEILEGKNIDGGIYGSKNDMQDFLNLADKSHIDFSNYNRMVKFDKNIEDKITEDEFNLGNMFQFNDGTILKKDNIIEVTNANNQEEKEVVTRTVNYADNVKYLKGIDVSAAKDDIDFEVGNKFVDYYIFKCAGFDSGYYVDSYLDRNVSECQRTNMPFGLYYVGTATNPEDAREEVRMVIDSLEERGITPNDLDFPLYWDVEAQYNIGSIKEEDPEYFKDILGAVIDEIRGAGYYPGIYASAWGMEEYYDEFPNCSFWVANPDFRESDKDYYSTPVDYKEFFESDNYYKRDFNGVGLDHVQVSERGNMEYVDKEGNIRNIFNIYNRGGLDMDYCDPSLPVKVNENKMVNTNGRKY